MREECTIKLLYCHHTFLPFLALLKFLMPAIICLPYCTCDIHRGCYTVSKRYGFYLRVAKISHELGAAKRVRCFGHEKIKFWKPCNVLFIIWAPNKRWFPKEQQRFGHRQVYYRHQPGKTIYETFGKLQKLFKSVFQLFL